MVLTPPPPLSPYFSRALEERPSVNFVEGSTAASVYATVPHIDGHGSRHHNVSMLTYMAHMSG